MDDMEIDSIGDVPDTPDRLTAQTNKGKSSMERGSNLYASGHSGHRNHSVDDTRNGLKVNDRGSRKLLIHAPKGVLSSSKSDNRSNLAFASGNASSSSSNNSLIFRRVPGEIPSYENKHFHSTEDNSWLPTQSSTGHFVNLTEQNGHLQGGKRDYPCTVRGDSRAEGYGKNPVSTSRLPSSSVMSNSTMTSRCANKGKEPNNKASGFDCDDVIGSLTETQPKAGKVVPTPLNDVNSPRVTGQKRLVRNGCISPHNIAKNKQIVGMDKNGDIDIGTKYVASIAPQIGDGAKESITEDIDLRKSKGKGIMMTHPLAVEESNAQKTHSRKPVSIGEIVKEGGDSNNDRFGSLEELGGWRTTRNRSKKMNLPVSEEHKHLSHERGDPCLVNQLPGNGVTRRNVGSSAGISNKFPTGQDSTSNQSASLLPPRHRVSNHSSQLDQFNGHQAARNMLKRQKHGSSSGSQVESSAATLDDSDIVFLGSLGNASKSSSTQTRSRNSLSTLETVIEIDEASPEVRGDGFSATTGNGSSADAMARQIEADEMFARELQEQFYNEVPSVGVGEDDVHMAMALQHEESSARAFPRRSQHVFNPRSSLMPSSIRQSQSRSTLNPFRRSPQARGPTLNRMARFRSRFPGRPRTISSPSSSSRERNSLFPSDMDVDMRMYILEALEAFSDMGVDNNFLQMQREFNENDYEMLLTLDENNHHHGGATDHQINGLPQSTIQSENLEEACAICLETPSIGDIIRHLPCLHKFHKDCIDPWLRRRTSCPICKSSIT